MVKTSEGTVVGNANGEFVTDETGSILIDGIEPGTSLVIHEIETIPGYILDTTPKTITTKAGKTVVVTFTNQPDGTLIVEKYDKSTGKPLKGVEFKITTATGELLPDNAGLTSTNGIYTTDANGQIVLSHIKPGSYIITETRPLPGYSIDGETAQTVVVQSGSIHTARFYNTPDGTLVVKKIDSVTKEPLSGVKFEIKTVSGTDFETKVYTTDEDGLITLTHLPTGTYAVIEKMALPGYELDNIKNPY